MKKIVSLLLVMSFLVGIAQAIDIDLFIENVQSIRRDAQQIERLAEIYTLGEVEVREYGNITLTTAMKTAIINKAILLKTKLIANTTNLQNLPGE